MTTTTTTTSEAPAAPAEFNGVPVEKLRGTTVLLYAKHHETSDWSNLLHWLSACLYVAIATGLSVKANSTAVRALPPVEGVLLPQVT